MGNSQARRTSVTRVFKAFIIKTRQASIQRDAKPQKHQLCINCQVLESSTPALKTDLQHHLNFQISKRLPAKRIVQVLMPLQKIITTIFRLLSRITTCEVAGKTVTYAIYALVGMVSMSHTSTTETLRSITTLEQLITNSKVLD